MSGSRSAFTRALAALALLLLAGGIAACRAADPPGPGEASPAADPLAAEIERWSAFLRDKAGDPRWASARQSGEPALARAGQALQDGRRLLALQRLANVRGNLATMAYMLERPAGQRKEMARFEAEWKRMGQVLRADLGGPSPAALDGVRPAAARALAEAALPQVKLNYQASLGYGRTTEPDSGLFYLGSAQAQHDLIAMLRDLSPASSEPPPPLRDLTPELDALEAAMLAAYRPPASIERHGEFIGASSTVKEARELNAAGLRHGALLRYLQAALRIAPLAGQAAGPAAPPPSSPADSELAARLRQHAARLSGSGGDASLGQLFVELAEGELAEAPGEAPADAAISRGIAAAIDSDVLPRYVAALGPAPRPTLRSTPRPAPTVTVTLVRWPYT